MGVLDAIGEALVPRRCCACGRACRLGTPVCGGCAGWLERARPLWGSGPPGLDRAWSAAPHEGAARALVGALKFRRLLPVADLMAERIGRGAPGALLAGTIVPVPTARSRSLGRGFDPALEIAAALAERSGLALGPCLVRSGGGRQLGRRRAERIGEPPRIRCRGPAPRSALLVDDVLTTGATLSACARALRGAGSVRVVGATFARRL